MLSDLFREKHLLALLSAYEKSGGPIDNALREYCQKQRALGSKDRKYIGEVAYEMIRFKRLIDSSIEGEISWQTRLEAYKKGIFRSSVFVNGQPEDVQVSFPKFLFDRLVRSLGKEETMRVCRVSNERAPTTIRVNSLKTTREKLLANWEGDILPTVSALSPYALNVAPNSNLLGMKAYKEGFFEIQDEASQIAALRLDVAPGMRVLDMCAGSGGKTLAFAPIMEGRGQIFLYDIRENVLLAAKKRLARAGIQNFQIVDPEKKKIKIFLGRFDRILLDVPCSGTGTIRRNPDIKWRLTNEEIDLYIATGKTLFQEALKYLKPGGKIVYTTCSVLAEENQELIDFFEKTYPVKRCIPDFISTPFSGGMDGFFSASLLLPSSIE